MEQMLPPETAEGTGFEPPRVRQFTIFLENKVGRLQNLIRSMERGVGRIVALSIEESGDCSLVRMICGHADFGRELLRTSGLGFSESELLAVELPKRTRQPILSLTSALLAAEINIHYVYPFIIRPRGGAVLAMHVDDAVLASQLLIKKGFTLIAQSDLEK